MLWLLFKVRNDLFVWCTMIKARSESRIAYAKNIGPFGKRMSFAFVRDVPIHAGIVGLLFCGCPTAILGRIRTIVVDSVNRQSRLWPWSHISIESCKVGAPSLAHDNTAFSIVVIRSMIGVVAARFHADPYLILRELG